VEAEALLWMLSLRIYGFKIFKEKMNGFNAWTGRVVGQHTGLAQMITLVEGFAFTSLTVEPHSESWSAKVLFFTNYMCLFWKWGIPWYTMVYPQIKNVFVQVFRQLYQGIPPNSCLHGCLHREIDDRTIGFGACFSASSVRSLAIDLAHAGRDGKTHCVHCISMT
jgi:hypothetical protein